MKRFIGITVLFSVSILAIWVFFEVFAATPPDTSSNSAPIEIRDETDEMLKASHSVGLPVPVTGANMKIAPVFDSKGAVVSDPTGTMVKANQSEDVALPVTGTEVKIAPVFDITGAVVSDPTGTILSVINP